MINAGFFVGELTVGLISRSMGLIADALDMGADASVYVLSLAAVGTAAARKKQLARTSGYLQIGLAALGLAEVLRRFFVDNELPSPASMIVMSVLALAGNIVTLLVLQRVRSGEAHLQASWIFTANDIKVNGLVIAAAIGVMVTDSAIPDLHRRCRDLRRRRQRRPSNPQDQPMNSARRPTMIAWIVALVAIDLASKIWAVDTPRRRSRRRFPAPSTSNSVTTAGRRSVCSRTCRALLIVVVTSGVAIALIRAWWSGRTPTGPVALIIAGAVANAIDRLEAGSVVDMLHTGWWPTFNIADIYITTGVAWWAFLSTRSERPASSTADPTEAEPERIRSDESGPLSAQGADQDPNVQDSSESG